MNLNFNLDDHFTLKCSVINLILKYQYFIFELFSKMIIVIVRFTVFIKSRHMKFQDYNK